MVKNFSLFRCVRQERMSIRGFVRPLVRQLRLCKNRVSRLFWPCTVRSLTESNDQQTCFESLYSVVGCLGIAAKWTKCWSIKREHIFCNMHVLMNKINGPFNPKYEKLHLRAYLLGTVSDVEIDKNDRNSQLVPILAASKRNGSYSSTSICFINFYRI